MSTVPQDQGVSASPPSYGDTVKSEPTPAQQVQQAQPPPPQQQLPPGYAYPQQPAQQVQYMVPAPGFQQPSQQPVQQMQYMVPAPVFQQQQPVINKPNYPGPHDFLILSIIVLAICSLLNITSLLFGIPALVFAILSNVAKNNSNYENAAKYSRTAIYLVITNVVYTLLWALLMTGLITGLYCRDSYSYLC